MSLTLNDFGYRHNRGALLSNVERPLLIVLCDHNGQRPFSHVANTPEVPISTTTVIDSSPTRRSSTTTTGTS